MQDHYAKLGIPANATAEQVKAAYRRKAAQYHPDKNPSPEAGARFMEVQEAYEVLGNPRRRKAYDDFRHGSLLEDPLSVAREIAAEYLQEILN